MAPREDEPFIAKGDQVTIRGGGSIAGVWRVAAARYASENNDDPRIRVVLTRGSSQHINTVYDPAKMAVRNNTPAHTLSRDLRVGRMPQKPRRGDGKRPRP